MILRKPEGQKWLVFVLPGATQIDIPNEAIAEWDTDGIGMIVYHRDAKKTMTIFPNHAITMVRSYNADEKKGLIAGLGRLEEGSGGAYLPDRT